MKFLSNQPRFDVFRLACIFLYPAVVWLMISFNRYFQSAAFTTSERLIHCFMISVLVGVLGFNLYYSFRSKPKLKGHANLLETVYLLGCILFYLYWYLAVASGRIESGIFAVLQKWIDVRIYLTA